MKARILSTLVLAGFTNLAVAGSTLVQQEEKPQASPAQQAPVAQQTAPAQQTPVAQQAAPTQAAPLLTARQRHVQRRAQRRASGQWTRIVRPAIQ